MAKNQTYDINMKDGSISHVEGLVINSRWGIDRRCTVSETTCKNGNTRITNSCGYYLTHIPSGMLISNASTQKALKELINREDMIDEDDPKKIIKAVGKFWNERGWQG